jgi:GT2 family glycosyltransferase
MSGPLISIIILNWNGYECIVECIESVEKTIYKHFEIIVVDNASIDGSPKIIKKQFPQVLLIALNENIGYAAGNNRGFQRARGKYIATLNNDVVVEPTWLSQPLEFLEDDETIGIIACRQMNYKNHEMIDCLYSYPLRSLLFQPMGSGKKYTSKALYSEPGYVIGGGGASAIYRKKLLDEFGGFDERYYSYHEESDLCMRAFLTGWKCVYAPSAVVYHRGSFSFNRIKKQFAFYHERNRVWFIYKFYSFFFVLKNAFWILLFELRLARVLLVKRRVGMTFFSSIFYGFKGLSRFIDSRKIYVPLFKKKIQGYLKFRKYKKIPLSEPYKMGS